MARILPLKKSESANSSVSKFDTSARRCDVDVFPMKEKKRNMRIIDVLIYIVIIILIFNVITYKID